MLQVTDEEYTDFFKQTFKEFLAPLGTSHFNVEGTIEFSAILFVPGMAPFERQDMMQRSRNIKLFVKRVFISDEVRQRTSSWRQCPACTWLCASMLLDDQHRAWACCMPWRAQA